MRKLLIILFFSISWSLYANLGYENFSEIPITGLGLNKSDIKTAVQEGLRSYGYDQESESESSLSASYRGRYPFDVDFSSDQKITMTYRTKSVEYKLNRRLEKLKKFALTYLLDCGRTGHAGLDTNTKVKRNLAYALTRVGWTIKKLDANKMTARSPGNGRVEVTFSSDGAFKMQRWDEMENDYTNPDRDRYLHKVSRAYDRQSAICAR